MHLVMVRPVKATGLVLQLPENTRAGVTTMLTEHNVRCIPDTR